MDDHTEYKVLYLEDDDDCSAMVTLMLGMSDIRVTVANSAEEALRLAEESAFDLYLLDALLPSGTSFGLCQQLRTAHPTTPAVFYTGLGFHTDLTKGYAAGATAYLVKPYQGDLAETLVEIIETCKIGRQRSGFAEIPAGSPAYA